MHDLPTPPADVAVIGYGPVGEMLANLLGKAGLSVLVLERDAAPYPLPRATHFDGEIMRLFQSVGLAGEIASLTRQTPGMRFIDPKGEVLLDWPRPQEVGPHGWHASYRFHQPDLDQVLRRGAGRWPNVVVRTRCEVYAVDEQVDRVLIRFEDLSSGKLCRNAARYVVGCDGARSLVRRLLGSELRDLGFHERWLVVDCVLKYDRPDLGDHSLQFCDPVRPATYVRGTGNRRRWEIAALPHEDSSTLSRPETVWSLLSRWITPYDAELERATVYTFHSLLAASWRAGRLLIAGDAAHQSPPFLGQGLCAGLRDAANLAWKLTSVIRDGAPDSLLDTYESERFPHVREYIDLAVRLGGLVNMAGHDATLVGAGPTAAAPGQMSSIKPRLGPGLLHGSGGLVGLQAPQPVLSDGTKFDEIAGPGFVLVVHADSALVDSDQEHRLCRAGVLLVRDGFEAFDSWLDQADVQAALIRPDRYVMAVARTYADVEAMLSLLSSMSRADRLVA